MLSAKPAAARMPRVTATLALGIVLIFGSTAPVRAEDLPVDTDPDTVGPAIESFAIAPASIDVTAMGTTITADATLTDDKSGVAEVSVFYRSPSGAQFALFRFADYHRTTGDANDGTYQTTWYADVYRESGTWVVASATTKDVVGNTRGYTAAEAEALGATPFTVVSDPDPDTIAPEVIAVRVTPNPIDVSSGDIIPHFEWDVTDTGGSGVRGVSVRLRSPSGRQSMLAQGTDFGTVAQDAATLTGDGGTTESTAAGNLFQDGLSQYSEPGTWTVQFIQVYDRAGNIRTYQGLALTTIVPDPFFEVTSNPTDVGSPAVTAFRFSPHEIDVSSAQATVSVELDVVDDLAGIQAAWLTFRSPTIAATPAWLQRSAAFTQYLAAPRITAGTIHTEVTFPVYDRGGDWTVSEVCVIDRVSLRTCYTGPSLGSLGETVITVIANVAPIVTVTGVSDGATYATAPTPACDVQDQEDGVVSGVIPTVTGPDAAGGYVATCSYTDTGGKTTTVTITYTVELPADPDSDADGVPDSADNCPADANADQADLDGDGIGDACDEDIDGDGLSNVIEIWLDCDPHDRDTDGDGVWDGDEVLVGTNPTIADSDEDGEGDGGWLLRIVHDDCGCTVTLDEDSNGNGIRDIVEYFFFGGPYDPAVHGGGGYGTLIEYLWHLCGCGPDDPDGNGIPQTVEHTWGGGNLLKYIIHCGCTPWDDPLGGGLRTDFLELLGGGLGDDPDGDGVLTVIEILTGCSPFDEDTDGDGLSDYLELYVYGTNPLEEDTDGDGMLDLREIELGCDPNDPDSDGDGIPDGTDPAPLGFVDACLPAVDQPVVPIGSSLEASAMFGGSAVSGTIDWGDGSAPSTLAGAGTLVDEHAYADAGVYTLTCTAVDGIGQQTEDYRYVVVFDPAGGFVTGGGWITSPTGAYAEDATLSGKATFGFVSKYKKGANQPDGNTEFQFSAAGLDFHSASYQWLVIAGARAKFMGSGTINGAGDYGFMLTATDGQASGGGGADKFRMKIWDAVSGLVVYDNQLGASDDAAPTTVLGGGSIVIHKK